MPLFQGRRSPFKTPRIKEENWDNFRKGLNLLLEETEIKQDELAQADNIVLVGKGIPTKRPGYTLDFLSSESGSVRSIEGFYKTDGTNELLAITDDGLLTIKSAASYTIRTGFSWASGYDTNMTQLDNNMYIVGGDKELARYSSPTLIGFPTIAQPTSLFATQISGASGENVVSYRVSSISNVGETLASSNFALIDQPQDLTEGAVKLQWSGVSTASGILQGYNIYGRDEGNERFLGSVGPNTTVFIDDGSAIPSEFSFPPTADSTGGVKAKYITRFQDRLIYAGIDGEPTKVVISGRVPFQERTDIASGGNFIEIEPDSGDNITGIGVFGQRIVVFKERSVWQITLNTITIGNFAVTDPSASIITSSRGCIAPRSIVAVENDVFFLSREGVYVLGFEPNLAIDVLRTNELSAKIRPFFDTITPTQLAEATAIYSDFKYIISFPGKEKTMVYDRERLSWVGPWSYDTRVYAQYFDANNNECTLLGETNGPNVFKQTTGVSTDNGTTIQTVLKTRKEDMGDWTLFKTIENIYTNWRNVTGDIIVDIKLEDREGATLAAKSFNLSTSESSAGFGADQWGSVQWGDTAEDGTVQDPNEIVRWVPLYKTGRRVQYIIKTNNASDNYQLLSIRTLASGIGRGLKGQGWQV